MSKDRIFIGIGSTVLALRVADGQEIWRQRLASFRGSDVTGVVLLGDRLYANCSGELYCLDPGTGHVHWKNALKGLGMGYIAIAGAQTTASDAAQQVLAQAQAANAAAAAAVVAATTAASSSS